MSTDSYFSSKRVDYSAMDPYLFMAVLGKRVIHPGGRQSTEELLRSGDFQPGQRVLDVGCGVSTTAGLIARQFGCQVTAVDISSEMLTLGQKYINQDGLGGQVKIEYGDILSLLYPDESFDRVVAEAVTMFVDRPRAVRELVRVCRRGGRVLTTEFLWRRPPTEAARRAFFVDLCPGMVFDTLDDWVQIYRDVGLGEVNVTSGPFRMMTLGGFLQDEGLGNTLRVFWHGLSNRKALKKMLWMMPTMNRAIPYLGYITISAIRP